jgi:hypothetical protein
MRSRSRPATRPCSGSASRRGSTYTLENYNFCREKLGLNPVSTLPPPEEATPDSDEATTVGDEHVDWSTE